MSLRSPYWISAFGHFGVLALLMLFSALHRPNLFVDGIHIVLPPAGTGPGSGAPAPLRAEEPRDEEPPEERRPQPPPEERRRPQPELNVVKETDPDGILPPPKDPIPSERPRERDPEPVPEEPPPPLPDAPLGADDGVAPVADADASGAGAGDAGVGSGSGIGVEGGVLGAHAPWYLVQLRDKISANWRPPAAIGRAGTVKASFQFQVQSDGSVAGLESAATSENRLYDRAAMRAILEASPLPPLPDELGTDSIAIVLTFTQQY
ncbi:MAG: TonB C-terminal domain-containing protein [Candidatus Latescibacterota bacterium]|nr:MAG: TonB C-terminal domain-containing protein [Candidatus Latescibacterota bacterium]